MKKGIAGGGSPLAGTLYIWQIILIVSHSNALPLVCIYALSWPASYTIPYTTILGTSSI